MILFSRSTDRGRTFSKPVRLTEGQAEEQFADIGIGPQGAVYVTYREIAHQKPTENRIRIVRSTDGGQSFSAPSTVAPIDPFDSTDYGPDACGDGPFACPSGLTYARFSSLSAVAADAQGVHVVWSARDADGQAKIFARNSANGLSWTAPSVTLDTVPTGHQFFPDIATGGGGCRSSSRTRASTPRIRLIFRPETRRRGELGQRSCTPSWRARPTAAELDRVAGERRGDQPQLGGARLDALAVLRRLQLRVCGRHAASSVWTDTRDLVPGQDPRETGADDDMDGFDGFQTCTWVPNDIIAAVVQLADDRRPVPVAGRPRPEHLRGDDALAPER